MAILDLDYIEKDGLLYPNIETGCEGLNSALGKYGEMRLHYLHAHGPQMYLELLFSGKLPEHCASIDKAAFDRAEQIRADYLEKHPVPSEDAMERIRLSTQAQMVADEIVTEELIFV